MNPSINGTKIRVLKFEGDEHAFRNRPQNKDAGFVLLAELKAQAVWWTHEELRTFQDTDRIPSDGYFIFRNITLKRLGINPSPEGANWNRYRFQFNINGEWSLRPVEVVEMRPESPFRGTFRLWYAYFREIRPEGSLPTSESVKETNENMGKDINALIDRVTIIPQVTPEQVPQVPAVPGYSAIPPQPMTIIPNRTLTVSVVGTGQVFVEGVLYTTPIVVPQNTVLTMAAIGQGDWHFDSYSGGINSSNSTITFAMTSDRNVTVTFIEVPQAYSLIGWGDGRAGNISIPAPNSGFTGMAMGETHTLALRDTGVIEAFGGNNQGQCNVPAPNADFVRVGAGTEFSLAIKSDGSLVGWGSDGGGQLTNLPAGNDYVEVTGGWGHGLALKSDGSIEAWGWNNDGQCNVPAPNSDFIAISASGNSSMGLKSDGTIVVWGNDSHQQVTNAPSDSGYVDIACGGVHCLAVKEDGSIVGWGFDWSGQATPPVPNTGFIRVAAWVPWSTALKNDGSIISWGLWTDEPSPNANIVAIATSPASALGMIPTPEGG